MTPDEVLTLAREGHPKILAAIMNRSTQSHGITVRVAQKHECLHILLEGEAIANASSLITFVEGSLQKLKVNPSYSVMVYGRQSSQKSVAWSQEIQLPQDFSDNSHPPLTVNSPSDDPTLTDLTPSADPQNIPSVDSADSVQSAEPIPASLDMDASEVNDPSDANDLTIVDSPSVDSPSGFEESSSESQDGTEVLERSPEDLDTENSDLENSDLENSDLENSDVESLDIVNSDVAEPTVAEPTVENLNIASSDSSAIIGDLGPDPWELSAEPEHQDATVISEPKDMPPEPEGATPTPEVTPTPSPGSVDFSPPESSNDSASNDSVDSASDNFVSGNSASDETRPIASNPVTPGPDESNPNSVDPSLTIPMPDVSQDVPSDSELISPADLTSPTNLTPSGASVFDDEEEAESIDFQSMMQRPEALVVLLFAIVLYIWQLYNALAYAAAPEGSVSALQLARRLGVSQGTISRRKLEADFVAWSSSLDPDGIAWAYDDGVFVPQMPDFRAS